MSGYSDKLSLLAHHVFERLRSLKVRAERLHMVREKTKREWENFFLGQSYTISNYSAGYLLADGQWTILEKLEELSGRLFTFIPLKCTTDRLEQESPPRISSAMQKKIFQKYI